MKYTDNTIYMEGTVVDVDGGSIAVDFKGRLGFMKVPLRMVISEKPLQKGQIVAFRMSYLEIKDEEG